MLPALIGVSDGRLANAPWYFPFFGLHGLRQAELLLVAEKFANKHNFTIDALDIHGWTKGSQEERPFP